MMKENKILNKSMGVVTPKKEQEVEKVLKVCYSKACNYSIEYPKDKRICCPSCNQVLLTQAEWDKMDMEFYKNNRK